MLCVAAGEDMGSTSVHTQTINYTEKLDLKF